MTAVLSAKDFTRGDGQPLRGLERHHPDPAACRPRSPTTRPTSSPSRARLQTDFAQASTLEYQLSTQSNQLLAIVYQRDQIVAPARRAGADARGRRSTRSTCELGGSTIPGSSAAPTPSPTATAPSTWRPGAASPGAATPTPGTTTPPGSATRRARSPRWERSRSGTRARAAPTPAYGHVAYVEAVGPNVGVGILSAVVPAGDFEISEMNWDALGPGRLPGPPRRRQLLPGLHLRSGLSRAGGRRRRPARAEPAPTPPQSSPPPRPAGAAPGMTPRRAPRS